MDVDPLDADFRSLADEALRIEPSVRISTRTGGYKTLLVIEATGLSTAELVRLSHALKAHRKGHDLLGEFVVVNTLGGGFSSRSKDVPSGWPLAGA